MDRRVVRVLAFAILVLGPVVPVDAQVTTATLYGIVRDTTGAVLPGATITVRHEGTGLTQTSVTDERGEFVVPALPAGAYTLSIELQGFRPHTTRGLLLGPGQTSRQIFQVEVGDVKESVTVQASVPLIETAASKQVIAHTTEEVSELPLQRRNITGILSLGTGSDTNAGGVRLNGVAAGGTGITVDGTEANSNPEGRSMAQ